MGSSSRTRARGLALPRARPRAAIPRSRRTGVNAVEIAREIVAYLAAMARPLPRRRRSATTPTTCPTRPCMSASIHGGTALNIVPDDCTFDFEFRPLATDDVKALVDEVKAYARERLEPEMRAVDPATRIAFEEKSEFPGLDTPAAGDVVGLAKRSPAATSTARSPTAPKRASSPGWHPDRGDRPGLDRSGAQGRRIHRCLAARGVRRLP